MNIWIGNEEVAVPELTRKVLNDIDWPEDLLQDIKTELEGKQRLLEWLDKDQRVLGTDTQMQ